MLLVENFRYIKQNKHGKNKLIINVVGIKMGFICRKNASEKIE
jgi:hypothetical protein